MKVENPVPQLALGAGLGILGFAAIKVAESLSIFTAATAATAVAVALPFAFWGAMIGLAGWGVKTLFSAANPPKAA